MHIALARSLDASLLFLRCSLLLVILALATGCRGLDPSLVIVARSDLSPGIEVDRIDVELVGVGGGEHGMTTSTSITARTDLNEGVVVYEHALATVAGRHVRVHAVLDGEDVATRDLVFDQTGSMELIVDLPRLCVDVECDEGETCNLGLCASSTCVLGTESECPVVMCEGDDQCASEGVACATTSCTRGVCWAVGDDSQCAEGEWCDPLAGCAPRPVHVDDAGTDAGVADTGVADAGSDGGDAGVVEEDVGMEAADVGMGDVDAGMEGI